MTLRRRLLLGVISILVRLASSDARRLITSIKRKLMTK
jgi:hypothetical protein